MTDEEGRRRFHGAFTGGYSAGFYNTVGSLEGWQPKTFKSSRDKRASDRLELPTLIARARYLLCNLLMKVLLLSSSVITGASTETSHKPAGAKGAHAVANA